MRVEKNTKLLLIEIVGTSHNSVTMIGKTKYIAPPYNLTLAVLVAKWKFLEKKMTAFLCVLDQS